jgi:phage baseplate assembly protein W
MAISTNIKSKTIAAKPIGITLPIQDGNTGMFAQSFDTLTQVKTNILNLLNTRQGERRFQPTFGTRLWNLVFEQNQDTLKEQAINIVSEDIASWIPNVTVNDITANLLTNTQIASNADIYMLQIAVSFTVNLTKQTDTVVVTINNTIM